MADAPEPQSCPLCRRPVPLVDGRLATHDAYPPLRAVCPGTGLTTTQIQAINRLAHLGLCRCTSDCPGCTYHQETTP